MSCPLGHGDGLIFGCFWAQSSRGLDFIAGVGLVAVVESPGRSAEPLVEDAGSVHVSSAAFP